MLKATWVTTEDNPYDYFEDFDLWYQFDISHGYDTCGYIARLAYTSDELSPAQNAYEIERCVDEIIKFNLTGNYKKVEKMVDDDYFVDCM
jgi:hypothetical protein